MTTTLGKAPARGLSSVAARLALTLGVLAVSTSGPFFVMAKVSAVASTFWRTLLAGALSLMIAWVRGSLSLALVTRHARALACGGLLFGLHLLLWVEAFALTDYASNLLLLVVQPLSAALIGWRMGQPLPRGARLALCLAAVGMACVAGSDFALGPRALLGDLLCVLAGVLMALFFVTAQRARSALPLELFMGITLLVSALTALPFALLTDTPFLILSWRSWLWIGLIVCVTTLLGHGLMNLAARSLSLFTVNISIVLEPLLAIMLGALMFGASMTASQLVGGALLVISVLVSMLSDQKGRADPAEVTSLAPARHQVAP